MIRNLVEADFSRRLGLVVSSFLLWIAVFTSLVFSGVTGAQALIVVPVACTYFLFGIRGSIAGSTFGLLAFGAINVATGTDTFSVLIRDGNVVNVAVLISFALAIGYTRNAFAEQRVSDRGTSDRIPSPSIDPEIEGWVDMHQVEQRREQLFAIATEFNSSAHRSTEVVDVSRSVVSHISRALNPDFMAVAVADQENRSITVEQTLGMGLSGFSAGDVRSVTEALADPVSEFELSIMSGNELGELSEHSHFSSSAVESGIQSALISTLRDKDDLVAQIWICSTNADQYEDLEIEFISHISDHMKSAIVNARNSESLKQLQQYLVGQNEMFAQMQDGIESTEGELRLNHEQLTEMNESKTQFMSEVAHEIKSPLAVMIGYADLLRFDAVNLGPEQREYATSIEQAARQLTVLIDDLSDITNIESGHFTTAKEPHNVVKVIESVTDGLKISDPVIDRRLVVLDSLFEFEVEGDPARLSQVFTNLITNALKYSDESEPVEISTVRTQSGSVRVSISDRGLGISDEDLEKLFTPYFRSMNPEAKQRPGTGLGLFLSKSIIDQHGGTLTVVSDLGIGSTFTVELPSSSGIQLADVA